MLRPGDEIDVAIEKPAAGGRMIARHDGQVLLVSGVIPGERAAVRIERAETRLAFASAIRILEASPDRRDGGPDPLCGGCVYAHIEYPRQVALKAGIIADAFTRIGRIPLEESVTVAASPEAGYRMRARLPLRRDMAGFYREGSHEVCDARQTRQLSDGSMDAIDAVVSGGKCSRTFEASTTSQDDSPRVRSAVAASITIDSTPTPAYRTTSGQISRARRRDAWTWLIQSQ